VEPERIAARLWPERVRGIEALGGGITNHNFVVTLDDGTRLVLRIGGKDTSLLGIDRDVEHSATAAAADAGVAPRAVAFVDGYLVTEFVEGHAEPELRGRLAEVARLLRRFHDARPIPGRFDAFRVVERYAATAAAHGVAPPAAYDEAKALAHRIEALREGVASCPCHNDLLNANFIDDGERLWIVDWEYAGMGDRFFDLANFSINHELDDAANAALLGAYFGELRDADLAALRLMRFMSDFREAMWGVVQQAISELEFDFVRYADDHFARLERTAADPAFLAALERPA